MFELAWEKELSKIISDYKGDDDIEPLDSDETERLTHIIHLKIDLIEGNITPQEYLERLERRIKYNK